MNRTVPRIIALAPRGADGSALVIAAARAGALGLLDLEGAAPSAALEALRSASAFGDEIGARIDGPTATAQWLADLPPKVGSLVCVPGDERTCQEAVERIVQA